MKKLNITLDELDEVYEWLGNSSYSLFVNKILPDYEQLAALKLSTVAMDKEELLIQRAKIEGMRELIRYIKELKRSLHKQGSEGV